MPNSKKYLYWLPVTCFLFISSLHHSGAYAWSETRQRDPQTIDGQGFAANEKNPQGQDNHRMIATPAIWKMTDEDSEVWLLGTYHILPPDINWRSSPVARAIDTAESVYLEADVDSQGAQFSMLRAMVAHGFQKRGSKLSDDLTVQQVVDLKRICRELNLSFKAIDDMRPWNAYLTLTVQFVVKRGFDPKGGVDAAISRDAKAKGLKLNYFETAEEQISIFADLPKEIELSLITRTIDEWEKLSDEFDTLFDAWQTGNIVAMDQLINETLRDTAPELFEAILIRRNENWVKELSELMKGEGKTLIAVGAGHLVGSKSVITLLQEKGFHIERIKQ